MTTAATIGCYSVYYWHRDNVFFIYVRHCRAILEDVQWWCIGAELCGLKEQNHEKVWG